MDPVVFENPCASSPCGAYAECRNVGGTASCACLTNYIGSPPNCRPECTINPDCPSDRACMREKCRDPCAGACGVNANCQVINHTPMCTCLDGYEGDPFSDCRIKPPTTEPPPRDLCNPSPCGSNTRCNDGVCTCLRDYQGDPYTGCRPECVLNTDCPQDRACVRNKCVDPCVGTCGQSAQCNVFNHIPMCSCPAGMTGNAFVACAPLLGNPFGRLKSL